MWFDAMDVRDPLQLTDGVYGILAKYFFDNNANLWLWGLMGNKNPKGFELFGSSPLKPEFGGRVETPLGPGEIGLSYHHRTLREDLNRLNFVLGKNEHQENRIGFNGKWDVGVGVWVESSISFVSDNLISNYHIPGMTDMLNVGIDYTIPVGNGLGATFEYFRYHTGDYLFKYGVDAQVFGSMLTYPLNESDNLSAMIFYIPSDQPAWLNYVSWTRSYDNWSIYGIAFWNPETYNLPTFQSDGRNMFGGKGVQIMLTYNF
jgi:hypothetical protein